MRESGPSLVRTTVLFDDSGGITNGYQRTDDATDVRTYSRFGEKTNNLQECLPPRQTRPKRNASGFEKDLVPGTD